VGRHLSLVLVLVLAMTSCLFAQDAASGSSDSTNVAGKWQMSWQGRNGQRQGTLQLQQDGSQLTGTIAGERGSIPITGSINGNSVSFSAEKQGNRSFKLLYTGTLEGDRMSGTVKVEGGQGGGRFTRRVRGGKGQQDHSWTATRQTGNSETPNPPGNGF